MDFKQLIADKKAERQALFSNKKKNAKKIASMYVEIEQLKLDYLMDKQSTMSNSDPYYIVNANCIAAQKEFLQEIVC